MPTLNIQKRHPQRISCPRLIPPQPTLWDQCVYLCAHAAPGAWSALGARHTGVISRIPSPLKPQAHLFHSYPAERGHSHSQALRVDWWSPGAHTLCKEELCEYEMYQLVISPRSKRLHQDAWGVLRFIHVCTFLWCIWLKCSSGPR